MHASSFALMLGLVAGLAHATPTRVDIQGTSSINIFDVGPPDDPNTPDGIPDIEIICDVGDQNIIEIRVDESIGEPLGLVFIQNPNAAPAIIRFSTTNGFRPSYLRGVVASSGAIIIEDGRILGDVGISGLSGTAISALEIAAFRVDGNVYNGIRAVSFGSLNNPKIGSISIGGDLLADVNDISNASINELRVDGRIGASTAPVVINGFKGIGVIEASEIYATIDTFGSSGNQSSLGVLRTIARNGFSGDFVGTLETKSLVSTAFDPEVGIDIAGDAVQASGVDWVIRLADPFEDGQLIRIGGSLPTGSRIQLPGGTPAGLRGQITINAENSSASWGGNVKLGGTSGPTLTQGYSQLPSAVGGGAAGLAPFTMHESTASPANHHYVFITGIDIFDPMMECYDIPFNGEISFQLYGPASIESGSGTPAKVQVKTGASTWTDAFDIDAEIVSSTGSRGLKFVRKDGGGNPIAWPLTTGEYRIVPKADRIVCVDVTGEPTVVFEYYIELADGCGLMLLGGFDLNNDSVVCMQDMSEWMNDPVDLNGDETVCSQDATLLLRAIDIYQNR
ncbi:MAG: hypothetical protein KF684_08685 [Phycisphaeraceae bacterium]|nr:hypothetical protein [Phycisphaeraceae bacterium]